MVSVPGIPSEWYNKLALRPLLDAFITEIEALSLNNAYKVSWNYSVIQANVEQTTKPSADYVYLQQCYQWLEQNYAHITTKLLPGPKAYKNMTDFEHDVAEFEQKYKVSVEQILRHSILNKIV